VVEESRILQVSIFNTLQNNLLSVDFSKLLDVITVGDEVDSQLKQAVLSFDEPQLSGISFWQQSRREVEEKLHQLSRRSSISASQWLTLRNSMPARFPSRGKGSVAVFDSPAMYGSGFQPFALIPEIADQIATGQTGALSPG
jgi:hypothetical protein